MLDKHRYIAKSVFKTNRGSNSVRFKDFLIAVLKHSVCCEDFNTTLEAPEFDILLPKSVFNKQKDKTNIDLYAVIFHMLKRMSCCSLGTPTVSLNGLEKLINELYIDLSVTVTQQILSSERGSNLSLQGPNYTRNFLKNDAINFNQLVIEWAKDLNCCSSFPTANVSLDQLGDRLNIEASSTDSTCGGNFTATLRISSPNDNAIVFNTYNQSTLPSVFMLNTITLNTDKTYRVELIVTDCIGSATSITSFYTQYPEITIGTCFNTGLSTSTCPLTAESKTVICNNTYTILVEVRDLSNLLVYTTSYNQNTIPSALDINNFGLQCGDYNLTVTITDCAGTDTDSVSITIQDLPIAIQEIIDLNVEIANLNGQSSTACDTDNLPNYFKWAILNSNEDIIEETGFVNTTINGTFIDGSINTPTVELGNVYRSDCQEIIDDYSIEYLSPGKWKVITGMNSSCSPSTYTFRLYDRNGISLLDSQTSIGNNATYYVIQTSLGKYNLEIETITSCGRKVELLRFDDGVSAPMANVLKSQTLNPREFVYSIQLISNHCPCPSLISCHSTLTYFWEFLDKNEITVLSTSTSATPTYQWPNIAGIYYARLTLSNDCGNATFSNAYEVLGSCSMYEPFPINYTDFADNFSFIQSGSNITITWNGIN